MQVLADYSNNLPWCMRILHCTVVLFVVIKSSSPATAVRAFSYVKFRHCKLNVWRFAYLKGRIYAEIASGLLLHSDKNSGQM
jgi:hypothetical protein